MHCTCRDSAIATSAAYCDRSPLSQSDRATIASVLTWDMCAEVQPYEVITIAVVNSIVQVKLTGGRAALLAVETFKLILDQQRSLVDEDIAYVERLEQKIVADSAPVEVDKVGRIYRVWDGIRLLGTFYQLSRNNWVAEPAHADPIENLKSASAAQAALAQLARFTEVAA